MVDADGICSQLEKPELPIRDIISKNDWSVMTANVRDHYYDIYALRHKSWCPDDFNEDIKNDLNKGIKFSEILFKCCIKDD